MHERDAFKAIFSFGGTLQNLNPKLVRNLDGAISNARALASEVIGLLRPDDAEPAEAENHAMATAKVA